MLIIFYLCLHCDTFFFFPHTECFKRKLEAQGLSKDECMAEGTKMKKYINEKIQDINRLRRKSLPKKLTESETAS